MKYLLVAIIAFCLGLAAHCFLASGSSSDSSNAQRYWDELERYYAEMDDESDRVVIDGMVGYSVKNDPHPALAGLVAAGEIRYVDLVLPNAFRNHEANKLWMTYTNEHDDIVYAEGNPSSVDFKPTGDQPLHLQLWFRKSATPKIQELIRQLEALPKETAEAGN